MSYKDTNLYCKHYLANEIVQLNISLKRFSYLMEISNGNLLLIVFFLEKGHCLDNPSIEPFLRPRNYENRK